MTQAPSESSDAALWLEATSGTSRSFAVIYDKYRGRLFSKAFGMTGDVADAEEVVAMVFLEAWKKRADVRLVDGSVLPWLYATAGYIAMNVNRAKRRYRLTLAKLPEPRPEPDIAIQVAESIDGLGRIRALYAAVATLSKREAIVIQLCLVDELPLTQVAAVLDIPVGTIKSRLFKARKKLQDVLGPRADPTGEALLVQGGEA